VNGLGECVWFTAEECLNVKTKDRQFIYIFDDFGGNAFRHIVATGNRLVLCRNLKCFHNL